MLLISCLPTDGNAMQMDVQVYLPEIIGKLDALSGNRLNSDGEPVGWENSRKIHLFDTFYVKRQVSDCKTTLLSIVLTMREVKPGKSI